MRMAGPDIVLFVVGALLFGGATFAIVKTEGGSTLGSPGAASGAYSVTFTEKELLTKGADVPDAAAGTADLAVALDNVGTIQVSVSCADPSPAPVGQLSIQVAIAGPNGLKGSGSGACGTPVVVKIPIAQKPSDTSASGNTQSDAEKSLAAPENATAAKGSWKVTITGGRGTPVGLPAGTPAEPAAHIELKAFGWTPKLTPLGK